MSNPGIPWRPSITVPACFRSKSLAVRTVMESVTWETGVSNRLAVTTTSGNPKGARAAVVLAEESTGSACSKGGKRKKKKEKKYNFKTLNMAHSPRLKLASKGVERRGFR